MKQYKINELIQLIEKHWATELDLDLIDFLTLIAKESGCNALSELNDDILIYHLKMRGTKAQAPIPGLQKDKEHDFKTALLKMRGIIEK